MTYPPFAYRAKEFFLNILMTRYILEQHTKISLHPKVSISGFGGAAEGRIKAPAFDGFVAMRAIAITKILFTFV
jgi:hypothetical protein